MVPEVRKAGFGCLLERCGTHHVHHTMIYTRYMSVFGHNPYQLFLRCCMWWLVIIQPLPPPGRVPRVADGSGLIIGEVHNVYF